MLDRRFGRAVIRSLMSENDENEYIDNLHAALGISDEKFAEIIKKPKVEKPAEPTGLVGPTV